MTTTTTTRFARSAFRRFRRSLLRRRRRIAFGAASRPRRDACSRESPRRASRRRSRRHPRRMRSSSGPGRSSHDRHPEGRRRSYPGPPRSLRTARPRAPRNRRPHPRRRGRARLCARAPPRAASRTPPRARRTFPETTTRDVWTCVCAGAGSCGAWSRRHPPSANRARRPRPPHRGTTSRTARVVACGVGRLKVALTSRLGARFSKHKSSRAKLDASGSISGRARAFFPTASRAPRTRRFSSSDELV